jgi:pimeloyl-ACP methyl ester carboxylesterase
MTFDPVTQDNSFSSAEYSSTMIPIKFYSAGYKLLGTFFVAAGEGPHPNVILLHGFPGNENNFDIAHAMQRAGWNVLVFHYRGMWGSEGKFSWNNCLDDVHAAIEFVLTNDADELRIEPNKIILAGHSMGGFAALKTCIDYPEIKNIISFAGFNFGYFAKLIAGSEELYNISLERLQDSADIFNNISPAKLLDEMITCSEIFNLNNFAYELTEKNLLIIRAKFDTLAPAEIHHLPFIQAMNNSGAKKLIDITIDSGHSFSDSRIKLTKMLLNWMSKIVF